MNFQRNITTDYVWLNFYDDSGGVLTPASYDLQYWNGTAWGSVPGQTRTPTAAVANGINEITFPPLTTSQLRVVAPNGSAGVGWGNLSELWIRSKPIFNIVNVNSNLLLAVPGGSQTGGAQVQQYHGTGTPDELWELVEAGAGYYKIVNLNSGLVLGPAGASAADSAPVQQL